MTPCAEKSPGRREHLVPARARLSGPQHSKDCLFHLPEPGAPQFPGGLPPANPTHCPKAGNYFGFAICLTIPFCLISWGHFSLGREAGIQYR